MNERTPEPRSAAFDRAPLRVLVADDDAPSLRFLCDALQSLGAGVVACADGNTAMDAGRNEAFDLLLLDCRMPGAGALEIIQRLRTEPQAKSAASVAVATTAELASSERHQLLDAGFSDVLLKPCSLADLQRLLALPGGDQEKLLDDASALGASGDLATMQALRQLLRGELQQLQSELDALSENQAHFSERLHRLRSSCGFCGAPALAAHAAFLQGQISRHSASPASLTAFRVALQKTLRALDSSAASGS